MADKATVELSGDPDQREHVLCTVRFHDRGDIGREAELRLTRQVRVKDTRPVHGSTVLWSQTFRIDRTEHSFHIPSSRLAGGYPYAGKQIDIQLRSTLKIDDALLFDTKIENEHRLREPLRRPVVNGNARELADPKDRFDFFRNLRAIPAHNQLLTLGLALAGGIVMLINALVGLHDQFTPEAQTWLYSHTDSDGDGQSPLMNALAGSGALGAAIWFAMRKQLRKYMRLRLVAPSAELPAGTALPMRDLVKGAARVRIGSAKLRVVAYNLERGQYLRGSGSNQRTVSFETPVRALVLYEHELLGVPARAEIAGHLPGEVDFGPMFGALYPPQAIGDDHGLDLRWEVQFLHRDFVDHELVAPAPRYRLEDFLSG